MDILRFLWLFILLYHSELGKYCKQLNILLHIFEIRGESIISTNGVNKNLQVKLAVTKYPGSRSYPEMAISDRGVVVDN